LRYRQRPTFNWLSVALQIASATARPIAIKSAIWIKDQDMSADSSVADATTTRYYMAVGERAMRDHNMAIFAALADAAFALLVLRTGRHSTLIGAVALRACHTS
jgi:hypothetical protein